MPLLQDLTRDIRYAARTFRREPTFVAGVVLTFGLVIGANAAMFGLVQRLMLAPPPGVRDAERVVRVGMTYTTEDGSIFSMSSTSYPAFQALSALGSAFSGVAAVQADSMTTGRGTDLAEVAAVRATGQYFAALGVQPALGRLFGPADDELPNGNDVVVLSHAYWQRQFAGDPNAIGRELIVDDQLLSVIGVAPRGFNGTELGATDIFVPLTTALRKQGVGWWSNPRIRMVSIIARLRGGTTAANAAPLVVRAIREAVPDAGTQLTAAPLESIVPGRSARQSAQARIALWLSGVSVVVLLIATANVGTLLLLRAARRRRDVAVRMTLGAGRAHLARQALVESLVLALAGCVLGLVLSRLFADAVRVTLLPNLATGGRIVDPTVLLASLGVACVAGLLAGLGPLAQLGRRDLSSELRAGGGHGSSGRFLFRHVLLARAGSAFDRVARRRRAVRAKFATRAIAGPRLLDRATAAHRSRFSDRSSGDRARPRARGGHAPHRDRSRRNRRDHRAGNAILVAQHPADQHSRVRHAVARGAAAADHVRGDAGVPRHDGRDAAGRSAVHCT